MASLQADYRLLFFNLRHHFFSERVINNWNNLDNKCTCDNLYCKLLCVR